jgi:hypothetical protein
MCVCACPARRLAGSAELQSTAARPELPADGALAGVPPLPRCRVRLVLEDEKEAADEVRRKEIESKGLWVAAKLKHRWVGHAGVCVGGGCRVPELSWWGQLPWRLSAHCLVAIHPAPPRPAPPRPAQPSPAQPSPAQPHLFAGILRGSTRWRSLCGLPSAMPDGSPPRCQKTGR